MDSTPNPETIRVLLVARPGRDAELVLDMLKGEERPEFRPAHAGSLSEALRRMEEEPFDVALADLSLPDAEGPQVAARIMREAEVPVVALSSSNDETLAVQAVREGAQDILFRRELEPKLLARCLRYAIERNRMREALKSLALVDELTGLYNRRGFETLAGHALELARRKKRPVLVVFADLDDLKGINDRFGHEEGNRAIIRSAQMLRKTFRSSDIVARIGGDEFAALVVEASEESGDAIAQRLQENLRMHNGSKALYPIAFSVGVSRFNPESTDSVSRLLARADEMMYKNKRAKRARP